MNLYLNKEKEYFSNARFDLIKLIPNRSGNKVLEIGAGSGDTLVELKKQKVAAEVTGVELISIKNTNQENPLIDKLIFGNIEIIELQLELNYFDVILCGDVLEHLIDPWQTLKKLNKYLKPNGVIIISVPNIREIQTLCKILFKADFSYQEQGILDKTHLRFFCKRNILSMLSDAFFEPIKIFSSFEILGKSNKRNTLNKFTFGFFRDFLSMQYVILAKKS